MPTVEVIKIDRDELLEINRIARRKAQMTKRSQRSRGSGIEATNKRYTRKLKHRGFIKYGIGG